MYIKPDSTLYILRNVPLDTTYDHTLWFDSEIEQANYFSRLAKYRLEYTRGNALSYIRVNRGTIKVPYKADDLYDCNYIMFRNDSFGSKWFYAFIKSIEYDNNTTTVITFELDVMQTWHFDYDIDDCFVEREHSVTDSIYENTLPENVDLGDYISEGQFGTGVFTDWVIVAVRACHKGIDGAILNRPADGGFYNGTYHQVEYDLFDPVSTSIDAIKGYLNTLAIFNNQESILGMYIIPKKFVSNDYNNLEESKPSGKKYSNLTVCSPPYVDAHIGNYTPKNNKLYTFPYCFLECGNFEGDTKIYKYEYFEKPSVGSDIQFAVFSDTNLKPTVMIAPVNYMAYDARDEYQPNLQESISITNFPVCTYATSDAAAKFVQNALGIALGGLSANAVTTSIDQVYSYATPNPKTGRLSTQERWTVKDTRTKESSPNLNSQISETLMSGIKSSGITTVIGNGNIYQSATASHSAFGGMDFAFRKLHIRPEYARIVDDYFSAYGYATKRLKKPNRSSRPHWNYVKTIGCTITGSVPCDDMAAICSIYDSGITFWKNGAEVGNYSLDNSPS